MLAGPLKPEEDEIATALAEAVPPLFAALGSLRYGQVTVLDGRASAASVIETSFHSRWLDSFDGPYGVQQPGDSTRWGLAQRRG
ncbi:hypothetical protein Poly30_03970 [Planctomycetes bacterium Poly30]|uniref:Uncharacterized protein n=1 Tax=Saltatorellus ferox TaxID=2528018 RepID=A0A518ELE3_9BACT|nr:hypothetical protein Poly30_03970 [Planctomycetes bacterium Poly30]